MMQPIKPSFKIGIRGRLFWAFGAVAAAMLAATIIAWVSFSRFGETLDLVTGKNIPAMTHALVLADEGGRVIETAAFLPSVGNDRDRDKIWRQILRRLDDINSQLDTMALEGSGAEMLQPFRESVLNLKTNLSYLNAIVSQRLLRAERKDGLIERLRWLSADFIDEIEPILDDTRFNINLILNQDRALDDSLEREMKIQRALYSISADGSLLAELIGRAANIPDMESLITTELYFDEVHDRIDSNIKEVSTVPGILSLRQSIRDMQVFANGRQGLFALQRQELEDLVAERTLLARNQELLAPLRELIARTVDQEAGTVLDSANITKSLIQKSRLWLALAVFISLVVVIPFAWIYVGRGLVGRIITLDESMREIAGGNLGADVPVVGEDEIARMAQSLRTFRDTLSETQAELVQAAKLAALGQLTAGISHEINQPLAAIRHLARNAGLLMQNGDIDEAHENIEKISELLIKINRITASLRDLSRKHKQETRPIDFVTVVENVLTLLERKVLENNIEISIGIDPECRFVLGGQVRLEQVLLNLVSNAIDSMEGAPVRRLIFSTHINGDWVDIRIRDTGCGIKQSDKERIFDPFFTTKEVGEGLGLGLSVSYNIIKDLGGNIRVESTPGEGSTFWLRLKVADGQQKI